MRYKTTYAEMEAVAAAFCKKVGIDHDGMNAVDAIDCHTTDRSVSRPELAHRRQLAANWRKICAGKGWL